MPTVDKSPLSAYLAEVVGAVPRAREVGVHLTVYQVVHAGIGALPIVVALVAVEQVLGRREGHLQQQKSEQTRR